MTQFIEMNMSFIEDYRIRNETYSLFPNIGTRCIPGILRLQVTLDFPETQVDPPAW